MLAFLFHTLSEFVNLPTAQLVQDCDELWKYLMNPAVPVQGPLVAGPLNWQPGSVHDESSSAKIRP